MTTGKQAAVDQRLDQHADAFEIVLDRLDAIKRHIHVLHRQGELIRVRLLELESIVLPDKPDHDD